MTAAVPRAEGEGGLVSDRGGLQEGRPWLRAWLVVGLAAWAELGIVLVDRATRQGLVENVSFSPFHLVGYAALLTLAGYVAWTFFRAARQGGWRTAFPPRYGGLGLGFLLLIGWVVLDIVWRETLGINESIESGLAPPRLLLPAALVLLAAGPLREAIAERLRPGVSTTEMRVRWAGVAAAGVIGAALTIGAFNPVREPLNDFGVYPGVDASEIWVMSPDGSNQTRFLAAAGDGVDYSLPAWSSDGGTVAYTVWTNDDGAAQNIDVDAQTAAIWAVTADGDAPRLVVDGGPGQAWIPAWSANDSWISYTLSPAASQVASPVGPEENAAPGQVGPPRRSAGASIWVVPASGGAPTRLSAEGTDTLNLVWSPGDPASAGNAPNVAYIVAAGNGNSDIHVATFFEGFQPGLVDDRALAADPANDWSPAFSPDGSKLAFTSDRSGNDEIWLVTIADGTLTQLTDHGAGDWVPAFSPDGTRVAFVSDRTGEPEIWSMAIDGSDLRNLTNHPQHFDGQWSVAWSPDGEHIAYGTGSFGDAATSGWVREDFAAAEAILFGLALAVMALLIVALGAPFGSFALALLIVVGMGAIPTDGWRFLPGALVAGLLVDGLVQAVRLRHKARVAAAALPALANVALALTIGSGGTLAWSLTLLLGVAMLSGAFGWGLAEAVERLLQRPPVGPHPEAHEASSG
jgi:WD40-like Beta Propeller Repeat